MKFKTLHETIIWVLKSKAKPMSFDEIAEVIKKKKLWVRKKDKLPPPPYQVRLRTIVSKQYKPFFIRIGDNHIRLK